MNIKAFPSFPSFANVSTLFDAGDANEALIRERMKYVLFIPKMFDTFSAVASGVNGLSSDQDIKGFLKGIINTAKNAVKSADSIETSKDGFLNSLTGIKMAEKDDLVIALPFKQEFVNQVNHSMEWKMEKNRLDANFKEFADVVNAGMETAGSIVGGDVKGSLSGLKTTAKEGTQYAKTFAREAIINQAKEGFAGFNLGTLGLTAYTPMKKSFDTVSTMSFDFEWDLTPRNKKDAADMVDIIDAFRVLSYPWAEKDQSGKIKVAIVHQPALWDVVFPPYELDGTPDINTDFSKRGNVPGLFSNLIAKGNRFLCVIDSVNFSFGSENPEAKYMISLPGGLPNTIKMSIKMSEYFNVQSAFERFGTPATKFEKGRK